MGPLAHLDPDSGEVFWNPALRAELQTLHILETDETPGVEEEEERELEAQGEEEDEDQHGEDLEREEEEDELMSNNRRDENEEY